MAKRNIYLLLLAVLLLLLVMANCRKPSKFSTDDIETPSLVLPPEQEFEVVEYSTVVIEKSLAREGFGRDFIDDDGDGIPDGVEWGEVVIRGNIDAANARGLAYGDNRYAAFYPAYVKAIPKPGEIKLLGFLHYFDDFFYDVTLAIIIKQKEDDPGKTGTHVTFIGSTGDRTGNPAYAFYPRKDVETLSSYRRWVDSELDYALAADPEKDAFFILLKELGLPDEILIVAFRWF